MLANLYLSISNKYGDVTMNLPAKLLGLIATGLGLLILSHLFLGVGAGGIVFITNAIGAPYFTALVLSAVLALIAIVFGLRALLFNKICMSKCS